MSYPKKRNKKRPIWLVVAVVAVALIVIKNVVKKIKDAKASETKQNP